MFIEILFPKYPNKKQLSPKIKTHNFGEIFNSLGLDHIVIGYVFI